MTRGKYNSICEVATILGLPTWKLDYEMRKHPDLEVGKCGSSRVFLNEDVEKLQKYMIDRFGKSHAWHDIMDCSRPEDYGFEPYESHMP